VGPLRGEHRALGEVPEGSRTYQDDGRPVEHDLLLRLKPGEFDACDPGTRSLFIDTCSLDLSGGPRREFERERYLLTIVEWERNEDLRP
jgi:hypothetical protein